MADAASVRLRRYLRRRFTAAGVNDGAPPRRCHAARHRAPCAAAGGGGRDGHAGRSGGPSAALAISPVWGWRRFAFRRRGGPPRRPHHGSSRAARRLEAGIPGRPTVRAQRRPSLTRRPTTRRLALAPSLPAPTVVHAKTAAAGRGPPRLGPSAAPWGRRALHPHHRHSQPTRKPVGGGQRPSRPPWHRRRSLCESHALHSPGPPHRLGYGPGAPWCARSRDGGRASSTRPAHGAAPQASTILGTPSRLHVAQT